MAKNVTKAPPGERESREPALAAEPGRKPLSLDDEGFLPGIAEELAAIPRDRRVLLNIPIWGWTGDGKTCALITAVYFCDPAEHPLGFSLIWDLEQLTAFENSAEEYRGLGLAATASGTTERLRQLSEMLIDRNEWPPGTDEPSSYILTVRDIAGTLGYVVFPDIRGGSYREIDDTAREALRTAHAAILLVNPELYAGNGTDTKRYRDEILSRLQRFAETRTPVCVMITKADSHRGPNQATDTTHKLLTVIVERQRGLNAQLCRVSIVGDEADLVEKKLPPVAERRPGRLVRAWVWVVAQALLRSGEDLRKVVPSLSMRPATATKQAVVAADTIPELRQIGEYSNAPGQLLCAATEEASKTPFIFLAPSGELFESAIKFGTGDEPRFSKVGQVPDLEEEPGPLAAHYLTGQLLIGPRRNCGYVWHGARGGTLTRAALSTDLVSWTPAGPRRILGIDASGRLHSIALTEGKWTQVDHVEGFPEESDLVSCAFVTQNQQLLIFSGDAVEGIKVSANGEFGEKVTVSLVCKYTAGPTVTNRLGFCVGMIANAHAIVSGAPKQTDLGQLLPDTSVALAPGATLIAAVAADLHLFAAASVAGKVRRTGPAQSPVLPSAPTSMAWSDAGEFLAVTFADKTWALYRPMGLG